MCNNYPFAYDRFKYISATENYHISIEITLQFDPIILVLFHANA